MDRPTDRRAVLLACREEQLDSLLALRRIAAHLADLTRLGPTDTEWPGSRRPGGRRPGAALVCDDEATTAQLVRLGVPVLHLSSYPFAPSLPVTPVSSVPSISSFTQPGPTGGVLPRAHWAGWLDHPPGLRATGLLAPTRLTRNRDRRGALLLLSLWGVPAQEAESFTTDRLPALIREAARRTGGCTVICDTSLDLVRAAAVGVPDTAVVRAADTNVDARHAESELLLASPTMAALALARARLAPLAFLPPLGPAQHALAERLTRIVPVPTLGLTGPPDPAHPADPDAAATAAAEPPPTATGAPPRAADRAVWVPPSPEVQWAGLGPELDDLRGAQTVARTVRRLLLTPL
ncbi:CGA synthase-related protein [Kitasatospora sp. NPDC089797]|uniref:CGA synthase-related protein n=1 Tax=Kitasatospora sp. NPDC089797 TaxID=3155298 RepID=UPI003429D6B9